MTYAAACTTHSASAAAVLVTHAAQPRAPGQERQHARPAEPGPLEVGVGTGGRSGCLGASASTPDDLRRRFTEGLRLMKALWTRAAVTFDGRFWQLEDAAMEPEAVPEAAPAALVRRQPPGRAAPGCPPRRWLLRRRLATTAEFAEQVASSGRRWPSGPDPAGFRSPSASTSPSTTTPTGPGSGWTRPARLYGFFGAGDFTPVAVSGHAGRLRRGLREVADAGAELILLNPLFDDAEQMERLAAEVMPHLAERRGAGRRGAAKRPCAGRRPPSAEGARPRRPGTP